MIILKKITLETKRQFELCDITEAVFAAVAESGVSNGMVVIFCPHTTASIRLNHNEPLLIQDIMKTLYKLVPIEASYNHDLFELRQNVAYNERSNGHAHVKSFLLGSSETLLIESNKVVLGERQSVFFVELDGGRKRNVYIQVNGE